MAVSPSLYEQGTVTVEAGEASVAGSMTGWAVAGVKGGLFSVAGSGYAVPIREVTGDGGLVLAYGWPGSDATGAAYCISMESALAADSLYSHNLLVRALRDYVLSAIEPDGSGTLAERDALTPTPTRGYRWLRVEVGHDLELTIMGAAGWQGPFPFRGPQGTPGVGSGGHGLPLGGAVGRYLRKSGAGDGLAEWAEILQLPAGGDVGQALVKSGGGAGDADWADIVLSVAGLDGEISAEDLREAIATVTGRSLMTAANPAAGRGLLEAVGLADFTSGLNWARLPNGLLLQWGHELVTTSVTGGIVITLPTAYSNAGSYSVVAINAGINGSHFLACGLIQGEGGFPSATQFAARAVNTSTGAAHGSGSFRIRWIAIGT